MQDTHSNFQLVKRLWGHFSPRRRGQFWLLVVLMLLASFAEVISIGAVIPFLSVLTAPEMVFKHELAQPVIQFAGYITPEQLLLPITIAFGVTAVMAGAMRLLMLWANTRFSNSVGADLSISVYRRTLYQPYAVHCARNSSEIINGITGKTGAAVRIISQLLNIISSSVLMISVLGALLSIEPIVALTAFVGFGLIYVAVIWLTRKKLLLSSRCIARETTHVIKALQEGLGGIRDVLIDGSQETYCKIYRNADLPMRRAQGTVTFVGGSPRFGIEALGMILIAGLAYYQSQQVEGVSNAIPILGALALGAQRLLPAMQLAYYAWSDIRGSQASLEDTLELLDQPLPDHVHQSVARPMPFTREIKLNRLGFRYGPQMPDVLKQISLTIEKGSRVGFIGTTGSGKSTLLDIIMGLLQPSEGALEIDGQIVTLPQNRAWQAHVAHVPQAIFLADSSVEENIAFGVPSDKIDRERVRQAARQAQIADTIESWPDQYLTYVGEHGVRLSGGQRQRIGIARALYKQADVIIFDEATSALDNATEQAVMQAIENLSEDLTLIIVAHRLTTLKKCSKIVELSNGNIKRIGSYQEIVDHSMSAPQH